MVNTNKLRGKMVEQGFTFTSLADAIGISPGTLGRKIRNLSDMTLEEVELIRMALSIPPGRIMEYFFAEQKR